MGIPRPPSTPIPVPEADDDLALRAAVGVARGRTDCRHAERAFLQATQDLALCSIAAWERQRSGGATTETLFVDLQHAVPSP